MWITSALRQTKLSPNGFWKDFVAKDKGLESPKIVEKWVSGKHCVTSGTVSRISKKLLLPETDEIFYLPLWELLEDRRLTLFGWKKLMSPFIHNTFDLDDWTFPNDEKLRQQGRYIPTATLNNTQALFERGDIYGFMAIVSLVRLMEINSCESQHPFHVAFMYRALPSIAKMPDFNKYWEDLLHCIEAIHYRVVTSRFTVLADKETLLEQINDPNFEPIRHLRPRDAKTLRFIDIKDPVIFSEFPIKRKS